MKIVGLNASGSKLNAGSATSADRRAAGKRAEQPAWQSRARAAAILAAVGATCAAAHTQAATLYWAGGTTSDPGYPAPDPNVSLAPGVWDTTTANWYTDNGSGQPSATATDWSSDPASTDIASFGYGTSIAGPGAVQTFTTATIGAPISVGGITAVMAGSGSSVTIQDAANSTETLTLNGTGTSMTDDAQFTTYGKSSAFIRLQNYGASGTNTGGALDVAAPDGFTVNNPGIAAGSSLVEFYNPAPNNAGVNGPVYLNGGTLDFAAGGSGLPNVTQYNVGYSSSAALLEVTYGTTGTPGAVGSTQQLNPAAAINLYGGNFEDTAHTGTGNVTIDHIGLYGDGEINFVNNTGSTLILNGATPIQDGVVDGTLNIYYPTNNGTSNLQLTNSPYTSGPGSSAANPLPWLAMAFPTSSSNPNIPAYAAGFGYFDGSGNLQSTANGALDGTNTANYSSTNNVSIIALSSNVTGNNWLDVDLSGVNGGGTVSVNSLALSATNSGGSNHIGIALGSSQVLSVTSGGILSTGLFNNEATYLGASGFTSNAPTGPSGELTTPAANLFVSDVPQSGSTSSLYIGAQITSNGGANSFNFVKGGSGPMYLVNSVSNDYTGITYVNGGSLNLDSATAGTIDIPHDAFVRASALLDEMQSNTMYSGSNLTLDPYGTYTLASSKVQTLASAVVNGTANIGTSASGSTKLTISGELSGTGVVSAFTSGASSTAASVGIVSPGGDGTIGQLTFKNAGAAGTTLQLNSAFNVDLQNPSAGAGAGFDQLLVSDANSGDVINLNGVTLDVNMLAGYSGTYGSLFDILSNTAGDSYTGDFSNAPVSGDTFTVDGETFAITYTGSSNGFTGTGNDIVLEDVTTFVPEPAPAAMLLAAAVGMLLCTGRRRRRSLAR